MPRTVLIADDEPGVRTAMADALADEGYAVRTAADGLEALLLHGQRPADVIVTDVVMPLVDGHDLVAELRERSDPTPVVLMSVLHQAPPPHRNTRCLETPFELGAMLAAVEAAAPDAPA